MRAKSWFLAVAVLAHVAVLVDANDDLSPGVGTGVSVEMTGKLAETYCQQIGMLPKGTKTPAGLSVALFTRIVQKLEDGRLRLEFSSKMRQPSKEPLLVTLTVLLKSDAIEKRVTPANTLVYSSPTDPDPVATAKPQTDYRVQLDELKGVKLRTWKLLSEVGE